MRQNSFRIALSLGCLGLTTATWAVDLIGYLPYYRMNSSYNTNTLPAQLPMLDEIRYFGLTVASNGAITTLDGASLSSHTNRINIIKNAIAALPAHDRPRLNITLGGAGEAANFATIAASSSLRTTFAQNINSLLSSTDATSVDIDWEHPQGQTQFDNYGLMLQRVKQEVGTDRRVYATIDPTIRVPLNVFDGPNAIDGISLMTYELAWWANDPSDFNRGEHSLPLYAEHSTKFWTDSPGSPNLRPWVFANPWGRGAPEEKLGIGLPFFGRVIGTSQSPMAGTAYTYGELVSGWSTTDGNYYTNGNQTAWLPGPDLAAQRVEYAHDQGLQHVIIWEIGQDLHPSNPNSLLRSAFEAKQALITILGDYDGDRDVDFDDFAVWQETYGSQTDFRADGNGDLAVNAADFLIWRKNFALAGGGATAVVPEPNSSALLCILALPHLSARRRSRSKRIAETSGVHARP